MYARSSTTTRSSRSATRSWRARRCPRTEPGAAPRGAAAAALLALALAAGACSDDGTELLDDLGLPDALAADGAGGGDGALADGGVSPRCDPGPGLLARVDGARMLAGLTFLVGLNERKSHAAQTKAVGYLRGQLQGLAGLSLRDQTYTYQGKQWVNLEVTIAGTDLKDEVVMMGAHYDSASEKPGLAPGADDDASGVVTVLEAARALAGCRPRRTVRLLFFSNEEVGIVGSKNYVASIKPSLPPGKLKGMLSVDMVAYGADDEDLDLATRSAYKGLADAAASAIQQHTSVKVKKIISDHCG